MSDIFIGSLPEEESALSSFVRYLESAKEKQDKKEKEKLLTYVEMAKNSSPELLHKWIENPNIRALFEKHNIPIDMLISDRVTSAGEPVHYLPPVAEVLAQEPGVLPKIKRGASKILEILTGYTTPREYVPAITPTESIEKLGIPKSEYIYQQLQGKTIKDISEIPLNVLRYIPQNMGNISDLFRTKITQETEQEKMNREDIRHREQSEFNEYAFNKELELGYAKLALGYAQIAQSAKEARLDRVQRANQIAEDRANEITRKYLKVSKNAVQKAMLATIKKGYKVNDDIINDYISIYEDTAFTNDIEKLQAATNVKHADTILRTYRSNKFKTKLYIHKLRTVGGLNDIIYDYKNNRDAADVAEVILLEFARLGGMSKDLIKSTFGEEAITKTGYSEAFKNKMNKNMKFFIKEPKK